LLSNHGYSRIPKKEIGGCFEGKRPVGRPRGRRENTVWRNAVDKELKGDSRKEKLEGINWIGRGPKVYRSTVGEGGE
jgi:hypothetical protein